MEHDYRPACRREHIDIFQIAWEYPFLLALCATSQELAARMVRLEKPFSGQQKNVLLCLMVTDSGPEAITPRVGLFHIVDPSVPIEVGADDAPKTHL